MDEINHNRPEASYKTKTKKDYKAPELIVHGNIKKITSAGGPTPAEPWYPYFWTMGGSPPPPP